MQHLMEKSASAANKVLQSPLIVIALFGLTLLPHVLQYPNSVVYGRDEIKHLLLAEFLFLDDEVILPAAIQYPPGWALLLAFFFKLFGRNIVGAHVFNGLLAWATGVASYLLFRRKIPKWSAVAIGLIMSCHWLTLQLADTLLSDPAFTLLMLGTLLLHMRWRSKSFMKYTFLGLGILSTMAVRTIGIAVWTGFLLYFLHVLGSELMQERKMVQLKEEMLSSAPAFAMLAMGLFLFSFMQPQSLSYGESIYVKQFMNASVEPQRHFLFSLISRVSRQFSGHLRAIIYAMNPVDHMNYILAVLVFGILILATVGCLYCVREKDGAHAHVTFCYIGILFLWPDANPRLVWLVVPLLLFYAVYATQLVGSRRIPFNNRCVLYAVSILTAALTLTSAMLQPQYRRNERSARSSAIAHALDRVCMRDPGNSVATISCFKAAYFMPQLEVCRLDYTADASQHLRAIRKRNTGWLMIENEFRHFFQNLLETYPDLFVLDWESPELQLYRVRHELAAQYIIKGH